MTQITIIGNLTDDPSLRFIQSGAAVVNFTVAEANRKFDRAKNEWIEGEATFWRCSLWREAAENVAESLTKGTRVIVAGTTVSRSWDDNGQKRTVTEIQVDEIGPSLKFATAKPVRNQRTGNSAPPPASTDDPWASDAAGADVDPNSPPF